MKTLIYCAICIILAVLLTAYLGNSFSKKHEVQRIVEADIDLSPPFGAGPLVSIVWYKDLGRDPHKIFSSHKDIEDIRYRLEYKGLKSIAKSKALDSAQENILAFVYYSNKENSYRMQYVPFQIKDGVFYWPYGRDKKIAQILMNTERWSQTCPKGKMYLNENKKIEEKFRIDKKYKKISQIKKSLAKKDQMDQHELKLFNTCDLAKKNLMKMVSFYMRAEMLNDTLLQLNKNELSESLVHAFVQLPKFIIEDYSNLIKPEYIRIIRQYSEKYDDKGLNHEEQIELFQTHQKLNKQILGELQRRQDNFERILQINDSQQKLIEEQKVVEEVRRKSEEANQPGDK